MMLPSICELVRLLSVIADMTLHALAGGSVTHNLSGSTAPLYLSIVDGTTGLGVTGQTPTVSILCSAPGSSQDGFAFNGTNFVSSTSPIHLSMTQVNATLCPGLYVYDLVDPGFPAVVSPAVPITSAIYQIRYNNTGSNAGDAYEIRKFVLQLRHVELIGI